MHAELRRRAAAAGQSLQEYLLSLLVGEARRPTMEEVLERAGGRAGGNLSVAFARDHLRAERAAR